ncbi:hypothetical protein [Allonocardiopsis opalescens]|uniref:Uncharacterized protein n=1 Tax=Allonocardiopsis opalescens TaxID=1144618 RepID=A0A2T0QAB1_9ACTN|nr:hypothetical protein [Allonocardiopsis opalescens]PRY00751.1 hypothetical protein CLV72_102383 [Allonocardiopsis opalescens]
MPLTDEMKKLRESKAFYAVAGAGDLAAETIRTVPDRLRQAQERSDFAKLQDRAVAYAGVVGSKASEIVDQLAERGRVAMERANRRANAQLEAAERARATEAAREAAERAEAVPTVTVVDSKPADSTEPTTPGGQAASGS